MLEAFETSTEAYLGLCAVGTHGASGVGRYSMRLEKERRSSTFGLEPPRGMTDDLLPIPLSVANPFLIAQCSCNRGAREAEMVEGALGMLAALNFLNGSGLTDHPILPQRSDFRPSPRTCAVAPLGLLGGFYGSRNGPLFSR